MSSGKWVTFLCLMLGIAFLAAGAVLIKPINQKRRDYDFEPTNPFHEEKQIAEAGAGRLPLEVLTVFRFLAINYLWIRAEDLKNEGQYFDALHLSRLICELQPNLSSVWDFQAWNMAYNISVGVPTPPERWNWVRAGIELLRDKGIILNPKSPKLYHSLSWTFRHKVGGIADDHHRFYKWYMAMDMMPLVGDVPDNDELHALAEAPTDWPQIMADPDVATFVEKIRQSGGFLDDEDLFAAVIGSRLDPGKYPEGFIQNLEDSVETPAYRKLDLFVRSRGLRLKWKLDPTEMLEINATYGPIDYSSEGGKEHLSLDWRHPATHALYWALQGLKIEGMDEYNELTLRRQVYHSLQDLSNYGHIQVIHFAAPAKTTQRAPGQEILDQPPPPELGNVFFSEDLRMFPVAYQATLDIIRDREAAGESTRGVLDGSINLGRAGVRKLFLAGYKDTAEIYLNDLRERYPDRLLFKVATIDEFAANELRDDVRDLTSKNARGYIDGLLRVSYRAQALGNTELAAGQEKWAQQIYDLLLRQDPEQGRLNLPPLENMRWYALLRFFDDPSVTWVLKNVLLQRLEREQPAVFEELAEEMKQREQATSGQTPSN